MRHARHGAAFLPETSKRRTGKVAGTSWRLRQAGHERVAFTLKVPNQPVEAQVAEVIQSMAREGGFDISIETLEAGVMVAATRRGDYEAAIAIWSGRGPTRTAASPSGWPQTGS